MPQDNNIRKWGFYLGLGAVLTTAIINGGSYLISFASAAPEMPDASPKIYDPEGNLITFKHPKSPICAATTSVFKHKSVAGDFNFSQQSQSQIISISPDPLTAATQCFFESLDNAGELRNNTKENFKEIFQKTLNELTESLDDGEKAKIAKMINRIQVTVKKGKLTTQSNGYISPGSGFVAMTHSRFFACGHVTGITFYDDHNYRPRHLTQAATRYITNLMETLPVRDELLQPRRRAHSYGVH